MPRFTGRWLVAALLLTAGAYAAEPLTLIDFGQPGADRRIAANGEGCSTWRVVDGDAGKALELTLTPGANAYPGVALKPEGAAWDLSAYGTVELAVTNLSDAPVQVNLRVDNAGDWQSNPWNSEHNAIPAGQSGKVTVYFGWSWGNRGFALNPRQVTQLLVFTGKPAKETKLRIDGVRAAGKPGAKPGGALTTVKPEGGVLFDSAFPESQAEYRGLKISFAGDGAARHAVLAGAPANRTPQPGALFQCPEGVLWDLSDYLQAEFTLANPGAQPVKVICAVDNRWANAKTNLTSAEAVIEPGAVKTVVVPFGPAQPWDGNVKASQWTFTSDQVAGAYVGTDRPDAPMTIELRGVKASVPPPAKLPDWLGQRPPVPGNWTRTFADEFDGPTLDAAKWTLPAKDEPSIWGQGAGNRASNAYVEHGALKIRCEQHDWSGATDPKLKDRKYVTSVVTTFDKFRQRYGYFESRMKAPTALGLWPAFWMMPDRGPGNGTYWGRQDTHNGGMEIDIYEYLVRFGPYRYNVAMHWDGYGKEHQSVGTEKIYVQPDADGFITAGLLWEPGKLTFYANGREVGRWASDRVPTVPGYLMYTLPTGGWGTYGYVDEAMLPDYYTIDWVRVWQKDEWREAK